MIIALSLVVACKDDPVVDDTASDTATDTGEVDTREPPAELAELSDGECPDFAETGAWEFSSNGQTRDGLIFYPADPVPDMPVIFVWHPLGGTARQMNNWLDISDRVDELGIVVVLPNSLDNNLFEWDFWNSNTNDVTMYDDLRTCLSQQLDVDLRRITSTGMSAGALWTTSLSMQRGDTLAAILTYSGGTPEGIITYQAPAYPFPAMLMHGGDTDLYQAATLTVDFQAATLALSESLVADGHTVALCDHGGGHSFPPGATDIAIDWLLPHVYGEPSPFLGTDISEVSGYCDWASE